jgi:hypothetical protein
MATYSDIYVDDYRDTYGVIIPNLERPRALDSYVSALLSPVTQVVRQVDIYEADGVTLFAENVPIDDGSVNVDQTRSERRTLDISLANLDGKLDNYPGGFWYDKIIKASRGVRGRDGTVYLTQLGEFMIDQISTQRGSEIVQITGRDYTKKCLVSKFVQATSFPPSSYIEDVIKAIAQNAGISRFILPITGQTIGTAFTFERGDDRWKAITDIATSYGYECYFDGAGYFVMRKQNDPVTSPATFTYRTGAGVGNLIHWSKATSDSRLYNHIVVTGEREGQLPVVAESLNTEPSSPTRIAALGDRVFHYVSQFISTTLQAQDVADKFLAVHALEQFDINFESLVVPWLEVGDIVEFQDPDPNPGDPYRFLLSNFTIPLSLGSMAATGKRVTVVG